MFGDVWEWTSSSYATYPGYKPAPGALGEYNGNFMCNQYVLRGGSYKYRIDDFAALALSTGWSSIRLGPIRRSYSRFFT